MPDTFYNLKRLHVVFAASTLALLATTVWMVAADHRRPWKVYQRTYRDRIEPWLAEAELRQSRHEQSLETEGELDEAFGARLEGALAAKRPGAARRLLGLPFIDAFGRPLAIDQIWLPELTIDYNFRDVGRFDRCVTCHQAIARNAVGTPHDPAIPAAVTLVLELAAPSKPPRPVEGVAPSLENVYGLGLAAEGMLDPAAVTVGLVLPQTPAAVARLEVGDVIQQIGGREVRDRPDALRLLLDDVAWGKPLELTVRRGLPEPYCSHPRLDLYVGASSPHPASTFGCTICHDGQGAATDFACALHSPDNPTAATRWQEQHGWFGNEFWDFPMLPARFSQSRCLKCHHDVTDLEPSARFREPPAAKVVSGYNLVRQNGCFGCHEIRGVTAKGESVGPDMRLEPPYAEAAQQLLADPALGDKERAWARQIVPRPELEQPRRELATALEPATLGGDTLAALSVLAEDDPGPGTMRKVGTTLRHAAEKLDAAFLDAWTLDPADFRPETRMPRLFGMHEHLEGRALADARRLEAVEIRAVNEYLLTASQPLGFLEPPPGAAEPPSAERGKKLFQTQGCLGCHKHADFPQAQSTFGPDLSNLGGKLTTAAGKAWLVDWIRDPHRRSPRTLMPQPVLDSLPAADIAAYLLGSADWQPGRRQPLVESDLDELVLMHLPGSFPREEAERIPAEGIPVAAPAGLPTDIAELTAPLTLEKKLRYVGRRTIQRRGCCGCHDIPGFENAKPIGPALSDWGRKQESLLAFEQVYEFLARGQGTGDTDPFYLDAIREGRREGFIWQKLRAPRSFDYNKAQNKSYNEHLLMGRFSLTEEEREAIITFVLGLVADPPAPKYVYQPDRRREAIVEGRKLLDKYACGECHALEMERWRFEYDPDEFIPPPQTPDFEYLEPHFSPQRIAASLKKDDRGLAHAEVVGMARVDAGGRIVEDVDYDDNPLYFFSLWEPAVIAGRVCKPGGAEVMIAAPEITGRQPPWGGALARLLFPVVLQEARAEGSSAAEMEAFGWLPPLLVHEGAKVRPDWLFQYLLNPTPIRPAAVLRMPKYNLAPQEAARLVDYFAAAEAERAQGSGDLGIWGFRDLGTGNFGLSAPNSQLLAPHSLLARLDQAMRLVADNVTFCGKCHLVGEYGPGESSRTVLAPDLEQVGGRIRPDYLRRWLGNPKSLLPYTGMPVNFPPAGPPLGQDLLPGESLQQIDAVGALLLDYDQYLRNRTSIRQIINPPPEDGP